MEITPTQPLDSPTPPPPQPSHAHFHTGRRLRKLFRPNGRRVHIAATPEEHIRLTRYLHFGVNPSRLLLFWLGHVYSTLPKIEPDDNFDCYLHGSPEHVSLGDFVSCHIIITLLYFDVVKEIHAFHENRRHNLRTQHGQIYDEFERVKSELDTWEDELLHLSDHGVTLDANFSKFGYDANISEDGKCFCASSRMLTRYRNKRPRLFRQLSKRWPVFYSSWLGSRAAERPGFEVLEETDNTPVLAQRSSLASIRSRRGSFFWAICRSALCRNNIRHRGHCRRECNSF